MQHDQKPIYRFKLTILAENIRKARDDKGLTREQLAEATGLSPGFIGEIEFAKKRPSVATLYALAQALDTTMDELAGGPAMHSPETRRLAVLCQGLEEISILAEKTLSDWKDDGKKD